MSDPVTAIRVHVAEAKGVVLRSRREEAASARGQLPPNAEHDRADQVVRDVVRTVVEPGA